MLFGLRRLMEIGVCGGLVIFPVVMRGLNRCRTMICTGLFCFAGNIIVIRRWLVVPYRGLMGVTTLFVFVLIKSLVSRISFTRL